MKLALACSTGTPSPSPNPASLRGIRPDYWYVGTLCQACQRESVGLYPFGKPDQLEIASFMAHTAQLTKPHELEIVYDVVSGNAAKVMELEGFGLQEGGRADLVVIDAENVHEAIRLQPPRLAVFHAGRKVAGS